MAIEKKREPLFKSLAVAHYTATIFTKIRQSFCTVKKDLQEWKKISRSTHTEVVSKENWCGVARRTKLALLAVRIFSVLSPPGMAKVQNEFPSNNFDEN